MSRAGRLTFTIAACLAAVVVAVAAWPGPQRRTPVTVAGPSSTGPPAPAVATTTVPRPATTAVPSAPYPVGSASMTVTARTPGGTAVQVPTVIRYPAGAPGRSFPLLVFSPGYQIDPAVYDSLVRGWAAAGYVVAEPTYPDTAAGAPAVEYDMVNHPAELQQVITAVVAAPAAGKLPDGLVDPSRIAVAGQSDGGDVSLAAAYDSCCADRRIRAAVILSGAEAELFGGRYFATPGPPLLAVQGSADTINPPGCAQQLYDADPGVRYYLGLAGATHLSAYTDPGPQLALVLRATTDFLDAYVGGHAAALGSMSAAVRASPVASLASGTATVATTGDCPGAP